MARILQLAPVVREPETPMETSAATVGEQSASIHLPPEELIFGVSKAMDKVRLAVEKMSRTAMPILIQGEGGTGKEVIARMIHRRFPGEEMPFLKMGFAEVRDNALEDLNSFPAPRQDAVNAEPWREMPTCSGTLFVNEVTEFPLASQQKLMRFLHEEAPLALRPPRRDTNGLRLICTSTPALESEVEAGKFLPEVFHSLNAGSLYLPSLRERVEDIPSLVQHLWQRYNTEFGCHAAVPSAQLIEFFKQYDWPGNLRELASVMKRYVLFGSEEAIFAGLSGKDNFELNAPCPRKPAISLKNVVKQAAREVEHKIIIRTLREHRWNRKQAARALNISYRAMLYKTKDAGIPPKRRPVRPGAVEAGSGLRLAPMPEESVV
jgi:two-component system, NtrC family, response regulator AtoC